MKLLIMLTVLLLALVLLVVSIDDRAEPAVQHAAAPISFSYGYGTRGVTTTPFGDDGPVVIACEMYYED